MSLIPNQYVKVIPERVWSAYLLCGHGIHGYVAHWLDAWRSVKTDTSILWK